MQDERVVELNVACHPDAGVSAAILLQSEYSVFLCFNAATIEKTAACSPSDPPRISVIEFKLCQMTRFGGPNDEGLPEHPLYSKGLSRAMYSVCEVLNSSWAAAEAERQRKSAMRIRGDATSVKGCRHFLVSFHDSTFECLAKDLSVSLSAEPFPDIAARILKKMSSE